MPNFLFKHAALAIAFIICFLAVGLSYWFIPYGRVDLPNALFAPGLFVVFSAAFVLRLRKLASFWMAALVAGASIPAAVMARIIVETALDPKSHNLWPFEIVIAFMVGMFCATIGALLGLIFAAAGAHSQNQLTAQAQRHTGLTPDRLTSDP